MQQRYTLVTLFTQSQLNFSWKKFVCLSAGCLMFVIYSRNVSNFLFSDNFFKHLCLFISLFQVWEGLGVVKTCRDILGETDPVSNE